MNNIFLFSIGVLFSGFRLLIESQKNFDTVLVMAVINVVALNYVYLLIAQSIVSNISTYLENSSHCPQTQQKLQKKARNIIQIVCWILFIALSLFYVFVLRTAARNDVMSIMALIFSIMSEPLSQHIADKLYHSRFF